MEEKSHSKGDNCGRSCNFREEVPNEEVIFD